MKLDYSIFYKGPSMGLSIRPQTRNIEIVVLDPEGNPADGVIAYSDHNPSVKAGIISDGVLLLENVPLSATLVFTYFGEVVDNIQVSQIKGDYIYVNKNVSLSEAADLGVVSSSSNKKYWLIGLGITAAILAIALIAKSTKNEPVKATV